MTDDKRRKSQEMNDGAPAIDKQDLQERILRGIKPNVGEMTGKWVVDLSEGGAGQISVPTTYDEERASKFPDDMRTWVDKLFDDFQRYIFEYNKAIDQAEPELQIDAERPNFIKDANPALQQLKYHSQTQQQGPSIFQGHLYTRHWALLIRGEENNVKAFVLPVDFLIAFDTRKDEFKPYYEMRGARNKRNLMIWYVDAVPVSYEALGAVSKALFGALVKATRDELGDQERFKLSSAQKEDQETTDTESFVRRYTFGPGKALFSAQGQTERPEPAAPLAPVATPRPAMFQSSPVPAPAQASNPALNPLQQPAIDQSNRQALSYGQQFQQVVPAQVAQAPQQPQPPQQQAPAPQANPFQQLYPQQQQQQPRPASQPMQAPSVLPPQFQQPPQQQAAAQQQQAMPMQPQQPMPNQQQAMPAQQQISSPQQAMPAQPQPQNVNPAAEDVNARLNENFALVLSACQSTSQLLHAQMDALTKIGVSALHQQSMDGVMQVMKRTNSLKGLREKLDAFAQEWNNLQSPK